MNGKMLWVILAVIPFWLSACGPISQLADLNPYRSQNAAVQAATVQDSVNQDVAAEESSAPITIRRGDKRKILKSITPKAEEPVAEVRPVKKSRRSGIIGAYMDFVDNSPLNPMRMMGAGSLPYPVTEAMEAQGMK